MYKKRGRSLSEVDPQPRDHSHYPVRTTFTLTKERRKSSGTQLGLLIIIRRPLLSISNIKN